MIVLDADLHTSSKATMFKKAFPDRFIQVGIAEQNLFGISAGLALRVSSLSRPHLQYLPLAALWTRSRSRFAYPT